MTEGLAIDHDITLALDRWAAAIGTPDHAAASSAVNELLAELTAARRRAVEAERLESENDDLADCLSDAAREAHRGFYSGHDDDRVAMHTGWVHRADELLAARSAAVSPSPEPDK